MISVDNDYLTELCFRAFSTRKHTRGTFCLMEQNLRHKR